MTITALVPDAEVPAPPLTRLALIVRDDAYDRVLTPLVFAYVAACSDVQVEMLFVNWGVHVVMQGECERLPMSAGHTDEHELIRDRLSRTGLPPSVNEIIAELKATGNVHLYVCSMAAHLFGATPENLLPQVDGIVGATWFLTDRAQRAEQVHCY
jgi:peroxiredoxin family protein